MRISELIDLMVYLLLIQFGFFLLLGWLYDGPHRREIFMGFTVFLYLGTVLWHFKNRE